MLLRRVAIAIDQVIVALDTPSLPQAKELIKELDGVISYYKIGLEFFTAYGWKAVEMVKKTGNRVFQELTRMPLFKFPKMFET